MSGEEDANQEGQSREKILDLELLSDFDGETSFLKVFRRDESLFDLEVAQSRSHTAHCTTSFVLNLETDRVVPAYKNPDDNHVYKNCLMTFDRDGKKPQLFKFPSLRSAHELQRAFTGYRVFVDFPRIYWSVRPSRGLGNGQGSIQLWHFKPLRNPPVPKGSQAVSVCSNFEDWDS